MIIRWPGRVEAGSSSDRVIGFEDLLPTITEIVEAADTMPKGLDGFSFVPTILGKQQAARPYLYREFRGKDGQVSVRIGDWKGIRIGFSKNPDANMALYNLKTDIGETTDVAAKHPEIVSEMEKIIRREHVPSKEFKLPGL